MKILLIILFIFLVNDDTVVYLCDSPNAEVYHLDKNCEGLKKCKHEVKEVTLEEAKKLERRFCGFED